MNKLSKSLIAWGRPEFKDVLKAEVEQMDASLLPLQQGLSASSYSVEDQFNVMVIGFSEQQTFIRITAGIFYAGLISGCNCADDPTPVDEQNEYCEVQITIDKLTAEAKVSLLE